MKIRKWHFAFFGTIGFLVMLLFNVVTYMINGEFDFGALFATLSGLTIIVAINGIYVYFKRDKTPEVDERIRNNIIKYIAFASQIIFLLFMATLTIISFMGIKSIPIANLWGGILVYMFIIGIGSIIVKFR